MSARRTIAGAVFGYGSKLVVIACLAAASVAQAVPPAADAGTLLDDQDELCASEDYNLFFQAGEGPVIPVEGENPGREGLAYLVVSGAGVIEKVSPGFTTFAENYIELEAPGGDYCTSAFVFDPLVLDLSGIVEGGTTLASVTSSLPVGGNWDISDVPACVTVRGRTGALSDDRAVVCPGDDYNLFFTASPELPVPNAERNGLAYLVVDGDDVIRKVSLQFTTGAENYIENEATTGTYCTRAIIYDHTVFDLSGILEGVTTLSEFLATIPESACAGLTSSNGACVYVTDVDAGSLQIDRTEWCPGEDINLFFASGEGPIIPVEGPNPSRDGLAYLVVDASTDVIEKVSPGFTTFAENYLELDAPPGNYCVHSIVWDVTTFDLGGIVEGNTTFTGFLGSVPGDVCYDVSDTVACVSTLCPVQVMCPADGTVECPGSTDPVDTGTATVSICKKPPCVATYADTVTPGACGQERTIDRLWTASDADGATDACVQRISVVDTTPPSVTCPADANLACGDPTDSVDTGAPSASDACDPMPAVSESDATMGMCPFAETIVRTWTAADECGNEASCEQVIVSVPLCVEPREPLPLGVCAMPDGAPHGSGGTLASASDSGLGATTAQSFVPQTDFAITTLRWWGLYADLVGPSDCSPMATDAFSVTWRVDDGGVPGAIHAGPFAIGHDDLSKCHTGEHVLGIREWQFEAPVPEVQFAAGSTYWVEIVNATLPPGCTWFWSTAPGDEPSAEDDGGGYETNDHHVALCYDTIRRTCRSAGYWSTHSDDGKGMNVTEAVLGAGECLLVCGELLTNTSWNDADSVLEGLCASPRGTIEIQLARQLIALSLNCTASGYGPECTGWAGVEEVFRACNDVCDTQMSTGDLDVQACIERVGCVNEGGDPFAAPGTCLAGLCSDNAAPCSARDRSACADPVMAVCEPDPESCAVSEICLDGLGVCVPPGTAADPSTCKRARTSACTVIDLGRTTEDDCATGTTGDDEACCLLDGCEFGPVTEDLTPCLAARDDWRFAVEEGATVVVSVDTTDAATAADLRFSAICDTGDFVVGEDEVPCSFVPPAGSCPENGFVASADGICVVRVDVLDGACFAGTADYRLSVTLDGEEAPVLLVGDDV